MFMSLDAIFDRHLWATIPFHFWSACSFMAGSIVGSFLNVCIHRMPLDQSVVSPPSHCPHCKYAIPFYLNIPLVTWLWLRGKCRNCGASISPRYFLVELLTAVAFLGSWLAFGRQSPMQAIVYSLVLAGFIVATFIDFEHFIIPDEITIGGIVVGFFCALLIPSIHHTDSRPVSLERCFVGILVGAGLVYGILRLGKLLYGRQKFDLAPNTRVLFTESFLRLPDRDIAYDEIFYRKSDAIVLQALSVELADRCYWKVPVRLSPHLLRIDNDTFEPESVPCLEVVTDRIVVPREAMGLGDVKFMAAIGAFVGWHGVIFSLMLSAVLGAAVGISLIVLRKSEWSSRLPYGPYIAAAATVWIFAGQQIATWWLRGFTNPLLP